MSGSLKNDDDSIPISLHDTCIRMEEREVMLIKKLECLTKEVRHNKMVIEELRSRIAYYVGALVLIGFAISVFGRAIVSYAVS